MAGKDARHPARRGGPAAHPPAIYRESLPGGRVTNDTENHPAGQDGIVPIFATPFAAVHTGADREFNARLAGWCESQRALAAVPGDPLLFRGLSDLLESPDGAAGELRRLILEQ